MTGALACARVRVLSEAYVSGCAWRTRHGFGGPPFGLAPLPRAEQHLARTLLPSKQPSNPGR